VLDLRVPWVGIEVDGVGVFGVGETRVTEREAQGAAGDCW